MAEQTEEMTGFLGKLEDFFLYDDQSRWRAIGWIIGIAGGLGTVDLVFLGASVDDAVFLMGTIILLMSVIWISWYCSFRQQRAITETSFFLTRRDLVLQTASWLASLAAFQLPMAEARAADRRLKIAAANPTSTDSIDKAIKTLDTANAGNLKLDPGVVKEAGNQFLSASQKVPVAWDAALEAANYCSGQINPSLLPVLGKLRRAANTALYHVALPGNVGDMWEAGNASPENAALIHPLDEPNPFEREPGAQFIITEMHHKENFYLQPMRFRHFILKNATVRYTGGRVWLEDVYFVDCAFVFDQNPAARALAREIIATASVNFKNL